MSNWMNYEASYRDGANRANDAWDYQWGGGAQEDEERAAAAASSEAGRRALLSGGYQDRATIDRAQSRFGGAREGMNATRARINGQADQGLFNPEENARWGANYDPAIANASNLARTGGISDADSGRMLGNMDASRGYADNIARNGVYDRNMIGAASAQAGQSVMDQYRGAAGAAQSRALASGGGGLFAGASLMGRGGAERGKAMGQTRINMERENAESKLQGIAALQANDSNRSSYLNTRGANMISGQNSNNSLLGIGANRQTADATGRQTALGMLQDQDQNAMALAEREAALDMKNVPDYAQDYSSSSSSSSSTNTGGAARRRLQQQWNAKGF
jgi:hypothetical protein